MKHFGGPRSRRSGGIVAVTLLGGALALSGCSGQDPAGGSASAAPSASQSAGPANPGGNGNNGGNGDSKSPKATPTGTADPDFPIPVADKVKKGDTARFGTGVTATLVSSNVGRVTGKDRGAVAGPAYIVRVRLTNGTDEPISLDTVSVTAVFGPDAVPGSAIPTDPKADPLSGTLAPGKSASGTYVFALPDTPSDKAQVAVGYVGDVPIVVFTDTFR